MERESPLSGHLFLTIFTFGMSLYGTPSLNELVGLLNLVMPQLDISRQGLHERINEEAVDFFERMLSLAIALTVPRCLDLSVCDPFQRVLIFDSSSFQLPDSLAVYFRGCGGDASGAAIKILFGYDLKTLRFFYILGDGTTPDHLQKSGFVELLAAGDLEISDLGFFNISTLIEIDRKGAFYLSRLKSTVTLYQIDSEGKLVSLDLVEFVKHMIVDQIELDIILKHEGQTIQTRLIIEKVPEQVKAQRLRRIHQENQKKGRTTKEKTKILAGFHLHITNAPNRVLPMTRVRILYSLRWQIELIFKVWKSNFSLDLLSGKRVQRIKCMIFAKLLFIFISTKIISVARSYAWSITQKEVSIDQASKHLKMIAPSWLMAIIQNPNNVQDILTNAIAFITKHCLKGKCKKRPYPLALLETIQQGALA